MGSKNGNRNIGRRIKDGALTHTCMVSAVMCDLHSPKPQVMDLFSFGVVERDAIL